MMPYIQGEPDSLPKDYQSYADIINSIFFKKGDIGYLTIDESFVKKGNPHRGSRAKTNRALHTEVGRIPGKEYVWGGGGWGSRDHLVTLNGDTEIYLANNISNSCAMWNATHELPSIDGDLGHDLIRYPYRKAVMMESGIVYKIVVLTPHESLPVKEDTDRQFLRIISSGVHGREPYFTINPVLGI